MRPLVVLFHGLEGSSRSHYARALMAASRARSAGAASCRISAAAAASRTACRAPITPATTPKSTGCSRRFARASAGGAALRGRRLARRQRAAEVARPRQARAARRPGRRRAVSAPLDLTAAGTALGQGFNRIYTRHFLRTLKPKALAMARRFPGLFDARAVARARDRVRVRRRGHRAAARLRRRRRLLDARAAAKPWLAGIARADARAQRAQRSVPSGRVAAAAQSEVEPPTSRSSIPTRRRPCRLRDRALSRAASTGCPERLLHFFAPMR